jgi:hypothetical protein
MNFEVLKVNNQGDGTMFDRSAFAYQPEMDTYTADGAASFAPKRLEIVANCFLPPFKLNLFAGRPTHSYRGIAISGMKPTPLSIIQLSGVVRLVACFEYASFCFRCVDCKMLAAVPSRFKAHAKT